MGTNTRVVCTRCRKKIAAVDGAMGGDLDAFFDGRRHGTNGAVSMRCPGCGADWREPADRLTAALFDAYMTGRNVVELPLPR